MPDPSEREYAFPLPLAPLRLGQRIRRDRWPAHLTLVSNLRVAESRIDELVATARGWAAETPAFEVTVGGDADFGPDHDIPVQLVDSDRVAALHVGLLDALDGLVTPVFPEALHGGYRPHITRVGSGLVPGSTVRLNALALVEIGPVGIGPDGAGPVGDRRLAVPVAVAELGRPIGHDDVPAERAAAIWSELREAGIRSWVIGGWGIDALVGRQTRPHHDLDLLVHADDASALRDTIEERGGRLLHLWSENRWHEGMPTAFVAELRDVELDVHTVAIADGLVERLSAHDTVLPRGALDAVGGIAGVEVACATAEAQRRMHEGYPLPGHHRRDLAALDALTGGSP